MSANAASRIAWAVAVTLGLAACGRPSPDRTSSATPPRAAAAMHDIAQQIPNSAASMAPDKAEHVAERPSAPPSRPEEPPDRKAAAELPASVAFASQSLS